MHKFFVPKTGLRQLDLCIAYGLAVLIANLTQEEVQMEDIDHGYLIQVICEEIPTQRADLIEEILSLPHNLKDAKIKDSRNFGLCWKNLDGLLASAFTSSGKRIFSVSQMLAITETEGERQLIKAKATKIVTRINQLAKEDPMWIAATLKAYQHHKTKVVDMIIGERKHKQFTILLTVEPELSYGARSPISNHTPDKRSNLAIQAPSYASILAIFGAARFLRGQQLPNKQLQFYLPMYSKLQLTKNSSEPLLYLSHSPSDSALFHYGLQRILNEPNSNYAISYQTLQTQGSKQAYSIAYGYLNLDLFNTLNTQGHKPLLRWWLNLLSKKRGDAEISTPSLERALKHHSVDAFDDHLWQITQLYYSESQQTRLYPIRENFKKNPTPSANKWLQPLSAKLGIKTTKLIKILQRDFGQRSHYLWKVLQFYYDPDRSTHYYSKKEVQVILMIIDPETQSPLAQILAQSQGCIRFARALKSVADTDFKSNSLALRQALLAANDINDFLEALDELGQLATVSMGQSNFITVPNTTDLQYALRDAYIHSVPTISRLILAASSLFYPPKPEDVIGKMIEKTKEGAAEWES